MHMCTHDSPKEGACAAEHAESLYTSSRRHAVSPALHMPSNAHFNEIPDLKHSLKRAQSRACLPMMDRHSGPLQTTVLSFPRTHTPYLRAGSCKVGPLSHAPHQSTSRSNLTQDGRETERPYTIFRPAAPAVPVLPPPPAASPLPAAGEALTGTPSTVDPGTAGGFTERPTGLTTTAGLPKECTTGAMAISAGVMLTP